MHSWVADSGAMNKVKHISNTCPISGGLSKGKAKKSPTQRKNKMKMDKVSPYFLNPSLFTYKNTKLSAILINAPNAHRASDERNTNTWAKPSQTQETIKVMWAFGNVYTTYLWWFGEWFIIVLRVLILFVPTKNDVLQK